MESFSLKVQGETLEKGQNVQFFVGFDGSPFHQYAADFPVTGVNATTSTAVANCTIFQPKDVSTQSFSQFLSNHAPWTHGVFQLRTKSGVASRKIKLDELLSEQYVRPSKSTAYALPLDTTGTWTDDDRRKFYLTLIERKYPHLKDIKTRATASLGLRAEASLLLAMLLLSEDMKNVQAPSFVSPAAKNIYATIKSVVKDSPQYSSPLLALGSRMSVGKKTYDTYIEQVRKEVQLLASTLYSNYFDGTDPKPQMLMLAVGNGTCTDGILAKPNEAVGLFSYNISKPMTYGAALTSVADGSQSVVHFFVTGINESSAKASVTLTGGGKSYNFDVKKDGASGRFKAPTESGAIEVTRRRSDGTQYNALVFADGSTWDGGAKDFTFAADIFGGGASKPLGCTITCDGDETLFGLSVVPSYAPLAMLGLYDVDKCVPWKENDPALTDAAAKDQVTIAHALVAGCARLAGKFTSYAITMNPGGIGKQVNEEISSAVQADLDALWKLDLQAKQQLRASFLTPKVSGTTLNLDIRSYTDPDYSDSEKKKNYSKTLTYNKALSARRCWGILGLLVRKLHAIDAAKAKALWNAASADTSPAGRALYLAEDPTFLADMGL